MVNKEVDLFIIACSNCQLFNSLSHETHQMLHTIYSDTPFYVILLDFWVPGNIPYWYGYLNILTCLDSLGVVSASRLKKITS